MNPEEYLKAELMTGRQSKSKWVKLIADGIRGNSGDDYLKSFLLACEIKTDYDEWLDLLLPLFIVLEPKLSTVLSVSHAFCEGDCDLYVPSRIGAWIANNQTMYASEIPFFAKVLEKFDRFVIIDVESTYPHSAVADASETDDDPVSIQSNAEKLKQLYSVIKYYADFK